MPWQNWDRAPVIPAQWQISTVTDITPSVISDIAVSATSTNRAIIEWKTDELADSQVKYGLDNNYGATTTEFIAGGIENNKEIPGSNQEKVSGTEENVVSVRGGLAEGENIKRNNGWTRRKNRKANRRESPESIVPQEKKTVNLLASIGGAVANSAVWFIVLAGIILLGASVLFLPEKGKRKRGIEKKLLVWYNINND